MRNSSGQYLQKYNWDIDFITNNSKESLYFLGLIASDGNIHEGRLTLSQSGLYGKLLIKRFKHFSNLNSPIFKTKKYSKKHNYSYGVGIKLSGIELLKLNDLGITERKTKTLKISNDILNNEFNFKWFLRGFIDGDGSVFVTSRVKKVKRKKGNVCEYIEDYMVISFCTNTIFSNIINDKIFEYTGVLGKVRNLKNCTTEIVFRYGKSKKLGFWLYENYKKLEWRKSKKCRTYLKQKGII